MTVTEEVQKCLEIVSAGLNLCMLNRYDSNKDFWGLVIPTLGLPTGAMCQSPLQKVYWEHLAYSPTPKITLFIDGSFTLALKILKNSQLILGKDPDHIVLPVYQDQLA